ncbi:MAG: hypothetical protein ABL962_14450 [Fimbriimonadaceae bacterium]
MNAGIFGTFDQILRAGSNATESLTLRRSVLALVVCGMFYGAVMGSFADEHGPRLLQMLFSALKVPLLVGATFGLSLPAYFVVTTLMGLRDDFELAVRALLATQAVLAILLASFAPFTLLWYFSSRNYSSALLFNGLMFGLASLCAQRVLARLFLPMIQRDARHRLMMLVWLGTYSFIGIQMAWVLRPFVGNPADPTTFFRQEAWGNAYEELVKLAGRVFGI